MRPRIPTYVMLFHVTLTHSQEDCPGRRPGETPELIGPADRLEDLGAELSVTAHSVLWGASCLLWAEPEHVVYALLEAASLEAVERYISILTPAGWSTRAHPVFALPTQLAAVRAFLGAPASPFVLAVAPATPLEEPSTPAAEPDDDGGTADTLEGVTVDHPAPAEAPLERRITREVPHVLQELPISVPPPPPPPPPPPAPGDERIPNRVTLEQPEPVSTAPTVMRQAAPDPPAPTAPIPPGPIPDPGAVTRFVPRPAILESRSSSSVTPVPPGQAVSLPESVTPAEPYSPSESSTVILEPIAQRPPGLRLVANSGPAVGATFDVGEAGATLGRLPENTICLTDGRLSRYHARIEFREGGFWLSDLGSQNGTLVNDRPVTDARRLQAGDSLQLGTSRLTVVLDPDD